MCIYIYIYIYITEKSCALYDCVSWLRLPIIPLLIQIKESCCCDDPMVNKLHVHIIADKKLKHYHHYCYYYCYYYAVAIIITSHNMIMFSKTQTCLPSVNHA